MVTPGGGSSEGMVTPGRIGLFACERVVGASTEGAINIVGRTRVRLNRVVCG